jgi:hypothetical protein
VTKHERYNRSEKGRARYARYEAKREHDNSPRRQLSVMLAQAKYNANRRVQ